VMIRNLDVMLRKTRCGAEVCLSFDFFFFFVFLSFFLISSHFVSNVNQYKI
jgi:hypothetical protein